MSSKDDKPEKDYRAMIRARAEQSRQLRQVAIDKMETPTSKSLRQKVELEKKNK